MAKYGRILGVHLLICTIMITASPEVNTKNEHQTGFSHLAEFLQNFIRPFLRSANSLHKTQKITDQSDNVNEDTIIGALVGKKIEDLKYLLDDLEENIDSDDKVTLRGNNETTIIEFLPKHMRKSKDGIDLDIIKAIQKPDPLKSTINKYKKLRKKIDKMLVKEKVSDKTKSLIIKTLDDMIAQLIESQCIWYLDKQQLNTRNATENSLSKVRNMSKQQWKHLRQEYTEYLTNRVEKENAFINQFHHFFSNVINDTYNLGDRYRIRCERVQIDRDKEKSDVKLIHDTKSKTTVKAILREKNDSAEELQDNSTPNKALSKENNIIRKQKCEIFILCSTELKEFLIDFYKVLNDTAVGIFKNYASMYVRDVNTNLGIDKDVVVATINNIGEKMEQDVNEVYKKELQKFKLDANKVKDNNMGHITSFTMRVVSNVKAVMKKKLSDTLDVIRSTLFLTVKEDLMVNLEVDLDNLGRHYNDIFCTLFVTCNGRYVTRRFNGPWTFRPRANNEVYVKVQLSLDDEIKNAAVKSGFIKMLRQPHNIKYWIHKKTNDLKKNRRENDNNFVTRTTLNSLPIQVTNKPNTSLTDTKLSKENEILST